MRQSLIKTLFIKNIIQIKLYNFELHLLKMNKMKDTPKIMLIDDSTTNNILYSSIFTDEGYDVVICDNSKNALKMIIEEKPSLIILDLMMPGIDGFELMKKIKQDSNLASIPIVMVTAKLSKESEEKAKNMGVQAYLNKPVGINEIVDVVKNILNVYHS